MLTIEAKQLETGSVFPTTSTDTGNYTLTQLPVGPYEITATLTGFKKFVRSGLTVQVAQTMRIDIPLEIGASSESVTVSAEASLLKTESGDVSSNVEVTHLTRFRFWESAAPTPAVPVFAIRTTCSTLFRAPITFRIPR